MAQFICEAGSNRKLASKPHSILTRIATLWKTSIGKF